MNNDLTPKQEKFVQNILKGMSQRQAYKEAFDATYDNDAIDSNASSLFNSAKVKQRYDELINKANDEAIMSAKERMLWLSDVIKGIEKETTKYIIDGESTIYLKEADLSVKIKALDTLNKMDNVYQQNINVNGNINNPYANLSEEELKKLAGE